MVNLFKKLLGRDDDLSLDIDKPLELNDKKAGDYGRGFGSRSEPDFDNEFGSAKTTFGDLDAPRPITPPPIREIPREPLKEIRLESNEMYMIKKDIEVISSKLDALKSAIESMNQRLMNIERIAVSEQAQVSRRREW